MGCEAGRCKTFTSYGIFIVTPSLEGWPTKTKEAPSPQSNFKQIPTKVNQNKIKNYQKNVT